MMGYVFTGLLIVVTVAITWYSGYVVYKLYEGQR
jgi:hypothetical protein